MYLYYLGMVDFIHQTVFHLERTVRAGGCPSAVPQWYSTGSSSQVSWVQLLATASLFTFFYFHLKTSKFLRIAYQCAIFYSQLWLPSPFILLLPLRVFFHHNSSPYMQWFKCDDAWITKATAEEVLASEG